MHVASFPGSPRTGSDRKLGGAGMRLTCMHKVTNGKQFKTLPVLNNRSSKQKSKPLYCHLPATEKVRFADDMGGEGVPLHCTIVSLRPALAMKLKVEVMSAAPFMSSGPTLVRVARKSKPAHCMVLQVTLWLRGEVGTNRTTDSTTKIGATVQEIVAAVVTLQV